MRHSINHVSAAVLAPAHANRLVCKSNERPTQWTLQSPLLINLIIARRLAHTIGRLTHAIGRLTHAIGRLAHPIVGVLLLELRVHLHGLCHARCPAAWRCALLQVSTGGICDVRSVAAACQPGTIFQARVASSTVPMPTRHEPAPTLTSPEAIGWG